ncbi:MAG: tetratricopeptide repeat protein, partial [Desulfobacterales bacterium]|nr:tetratricopeptide repeat protein [Desulfobacterales bacterium]
MDRIKHREISVCLFLIIAAIAVYWQVQNHAFLNFDDNEYVSDNWHVQAGLTLESITWAFSFADKEKTYWHPLTWLSHMLDCELYGLRPGMHHLTNLFFHIANSLMLFLALRWMTGAIWRSAFVAMLFAIHPINVDSVAWISERKNLLSTFFWMLTILAYVYYSKRPGLYRYLLTFFVFALGLMSKPMLVTLPCVLLLLDYWPLGRFSFGPPGFPLSRLVLEKIPFFALSALSTGLSFLSLQGKENIIISMSLTPLKLRIANALVSYVKYIGKMIWPNDLAVLYPYPGTVPMWQTTGALLLLVCISVLMIRSVRRVPWFATGWLWYLGTLVPVTGLVQAGLWPAMADRFAYVPLIGIFIIIAWGFPEIVDRRRHIKTILPATATAILFIFMIITFQQAGHWKNSITLFEHTLAKTTNNFLAHMALAGALKEQGRIDDAIKHYVETLRIRPDLKEAHNGLGTALKEQGRLDDAIKHYLEALRIRPDNEEIHNNLAVALLHKGDIDGAIEHFRKELKINPGSIRAKKKKKKALM